MCGFCFRRRDVLIQLVHSSPPFVALENDRKKPSKRTPSTKIYNKIYNFSILLLYGCILIFCRSIFLFVFRGLHGALERASGVVTLCSQCLLSIPPCIALGNDIQKPSTRTPSIKIYNKIYNISILLYVCILIFCRSIFLFVFPGRSIVWMRFRRRDAL